MLNGCWPCMVSAWNNGKEVPAFNQEKALVGAFSVFVQPVVEPMDRFTALVITHNNLCLQLRPCSPPGPCIPSWASTGKLAPTPRLRRWGGEASTWGEERDREENTHHKYSQSLWKPEHLDFYIVVLKWNFQKYTLESTNIALSHGNWQNQCLCVWCCIIGV